MRASFISSISYRLRQGAFTSCTESVKGRRSRGAHAGDRLNRGRRLGGLIPLNLAAEVMIEDSASNNLIVGAAVVQRQLR